LFLQNGIIIANDKRKEVKRQSFFILQWSINSLTEKIINMKNKLFAALAMIVSAFLWTSCGKDGADGHNGMDGNANVIASAWFTPSVWDGGSGDWYFDIADGAITADIVENGAILAYVSLSGDLYDGFAIRPLPAYAVGCNWDYLLPNDGQSYGMIEFTTDMIDYPATVGYNFRYILIPSSVMLKSSKLKSTSVADLKNMPYKDVCKLLGIQE
jgi:hypothetical protein